MASGLLLRLLQRLKKASGKKASGFSVGLLFCWRKQQALQRLPSEATESLLRRKRRLKESLQTLAEKLAEAPYRGF
jgi:hypothetical protein